MSVLPAQVHAALAQLLRALSSSDNTIRSQAEEQLNTEWVAGRPGVLLMGLVEQIQDSEETSVRIECGVALGQFRRTIADWNPVSAH